MDQLHAAQSLEKTESGEPISATPLWIACKNGNTDMVIDQLKNGASTESVDVNGERALHCAIRHIESSSSNPSTIVSSLIEHGASVNAMSEYGTPLYLACERGLTGVVQQLAESKAHAIVAGRKDPLLVGREWNYRKIVSTLQGSGTDLKVTSLLIDAASIANGGRVEKLLNHGAEINSVNLYGMTALHMAVLRMRYREYSSDDVMGTIRALLNHGGANLDALNGDGETALYLACSCNNEIKYNVVQMLLQSGADPNFISVPEKTTQISRPNRHFRPTYSRNDCRTSLLSYAARHNDVTLTEMLLKFGAQLELRDTSGKTALYYALEPIKHENVVSVSLEFLLKSGAQVNVLDDTGMSPLTLACIKGVLVLVKTLLSFGADPNLTTTAVYPLSLACQYRYYEIARLLLEHGADMQATNSNSEPALCEALTTFYDGGKGSGSDVASLLLDYGADPNVMTSLGETPLYLACLNNLTELVQRMLKCGAKVNVSKNQKSPLIAACRSKHIAMVELLLNEGADPNVPEEIADKSSYALHIAVAGDRPNKYTDGYGDSKELFNLLLQRGANVHLADGSGNTVLHHFMKNRGSNWEFLLYTLLKAGADVNICNNDGESPLYLAVKNFPSMPPHCRVRPRDRLTVRKSADFSVMAKLLSHGADPNLTTTDKYPLCAACQMHDLTVANALLEAGANPNLTDSSSSGDSGRKVVKTCELPLCIAAKKANHKIAELLLNFGAEVNALNPLGKSALQCVVENLVDHERDTWDPRYIGDLEETVNKSAKLVKSLLNHGADINHLVSNRNFPLSLLLNYSRFNVQPLDSHTWIRYKQLVHETIKMMLCNGAKLDDWSINLGHDSRSREFGIIRSLCAWRSTNHVAVDMLKAGAGFKLLAYCCILRLEFTDAGMSRPVYTAKSVRMCQAAIMAGCAPRKEELADLSASGDDIHPVYVELLSWLNEESQRTPSLMRQCRVAIRRQLSVASHYRTILPAIDQLPLPSRLKLYLKFEGPLTEIDLSTEDRNLDKKYKMI